MRTSKQVFTVLVCCDSEVLLFSVLSFPKDLKFFYISCSSLNWENKFL